MNINRLHHRMHKLYLRGGIFRFVSKFIYRYIRIVYSADLPYQLDLDGVYLCHNGFGVVINPGAVIGRGTTIQHSVTIGEVDSSHKCPIISQNCFIGARAMVLGDVKIGDNVKVGAGAVVIKDIPENSTVVGVPGRIVISIK